MSTALLKLNYSLWVNTFKQYDSINTMQKSTCWTELELHIALASNTELI